VPGGRECLKCTKVPKMPKVEASLRSGFFKKSFTLAVRETRNQNIEIVIYREHLIS
jgi:hypothetical protein